MEGQREKVGGARQEKVGGPGEKNVPGPGPALGGPDPSIYTYMIPSYWNPIFLFFGAKNELSTFFQICNKNVGGGRWG